MRPLKLGSRSLTRQANRKAGVSNAKRPHLSPRTTSKLYASHLAEFERERLVRRLARVGLTLEDAKRLIKAAREQARALTPVAA